MSDHKRRRPGTIDRLNLPPAGGKGNDLRGLIRPGAVLVYSRVDLDGKNRTADIDRMISGGILNGGILQIRVHGTDFHGLYQILAVDDAGLWGVLREKQLEKVDRATI